MQIQAIVFGLSPRRIKTQNQEADKHQRERYVKEPVHLPWQYHITRWFREGRLNRPVGSISVAESSAEHAEGALSSL